MKTYTYQEIQADPAILDNYSYKDKIPLRCNHCDTVYHTKQKEIKKRIFRENLKLNFCSLQCKGKHQTKQKEVTCLNCGTKFSKHNCETKKHPNHFCSHSCRATYYNKNKTHGTRRSKLERWLEDQLVQLYPDLEFHFNQKDAIGSELDIYIPSLKLAFELNGIFHYEPIFGNDKLQKIQENDSNKFYRCHKNDISLCIVDTSQHSYVTPKTSKKYLDIVTNIIDKNLG